MPRNLPDPDFLRKVLRYEQDSGKLFWRTRTPDTFQDGCAGSENICRRWNGRYAGREAFTADDRGYKQGSVGGINVRAHQVTWAMMTGAWQTDDIDHVDMDKGNNRWPNLRAASRSENKFNVGLRSDNTSGIKGVWYHSQCRKWAAEVVVDGEKHSLGVFLTKQEAAQAAAQARIVLHGVFARP
jgi:hypothetical protein